MKIRRLTLCALFSALLTVSAFLRIPLGVVSLTFQLQICLLSAFLLKEKYATLSVLLYLGAGFLGLPVFTAGGGLHYFAQPTAGYLLALLPCAYVTGIISRKKTPTDTKSIYLCLLPGLLLVDVIGSIYLVLVTAFLSQGFEFSPALMLSAFLIPLAKDILLNIPVSHLGKKLIPLANKH